MAEYLVQDTSLTAVADQIRVLSGTEDAMGLDAMANHVGEANTNVNTEAGLIEQISSALEGKAVGGSSGGGSVGSGDGTIETCSVTLDIPEKYNLIYQYVENGEICCEAGFFPIGLNPTMQQALGIDTSHVVKNSFFICGKSTSIVVQTLVNTTGDVEIVGCNGSSTTTQSGNTCGHIFKVKGDCSITITE